MSLHNISDFGLGVEQLEAKYDNGCGYHLSYRPDMWKLAASHNATSLNYWEWVKHKLEEEEDQLQKDSPYNDNPWS